MVFYFTGNTFQQIIQNTIQDLDLVVLKHEVSNEIDFLKYAKQSITTLESVETLIIDISSCINNDDEIINALEIIRTMYDNMKIIVFAAYRHTGDELLTRCFNLGILNIINTNDFIEIKNELIKCLTEGKTFKEAVKYKNISEETTIIKKQIKKIVYKKLIGMVGTESNIGVTHNSIVLGNFLRKLGYMIALVEMNLSKDFEKIQDTFDEKEYEKGYFTLNAIDYYKNCSIDHLAEIIESSYNFIIIDFGRVEEADQITLRKCDEVILVSGAKPWEYQNIYPLFKMYADKENFLHSLTYCFNLTPKKDFESIRDGMKKFEKVYFLDYTEDPFTSNNFANGDKIFKEYLPEDEKEVKKKFGLFERKAKGGHENGKEQRSVFLGFSRKKELP